MNFWRSGDPTSPRASGFSIKRLFRYYTIGFSEQPVAVIDITNPNTTTMLRVSRKTVMSHVPRTTIMQFLNRLVK